MNYGFLMRQMMPFQNLYIIPDFLTLADIIYSAILAFVITAAIKGIRRVAKNFLFENVKSFSSGEELPRIMQKCFELFPVEEFYFKGVTFKRGMTVKVTTIKKKTFQGKFIGINEENIICVFAKDHIAADAVGNISEVVIVEE